MAWSDGNPSTRPLAREREMTTDDSRLGISDARVYVYLITCCVISEAIVLAQESPEARTGT